MLWRLAYVGTLPASGTQDKQGSSLRGNLLHRVQTSVCFVPKDPSVAKRRTVLVSNPNNQGMDTLLLHHTVFETSRKKNISVFLDRSNVLMQFIFH